MASWQSTLYFIIFHICTAYILYRLLFVDYQYQTFTQIMDYSRITFINKWFFTWLSPLITLSEHRTIKNKDLRPLPYTENTEKLSNEFYELLTKERENNNNNNNSSFSLFYIFNHFLGKDYYWLGIVKLSIDLLALAPPILLKQIVDLVEKEYTLKWFIIYSGILIICLIITANLTPHYTFIIGRISLRFRSGLISSIYHTAILSKMRIVDGKITNLMSIDSQKLSDVCSIFHEFWSVPVQVILTLYLLYKTVGIAFLTPLIMLLCIIPINFCIAKYITVYTRLMMENKDNRVKWYSSLLTYIRTIRAMCYEDIYINKIEKYRKNEIKYLKYRKYLDAFCVFFWGSTPFLVIFGTLFTAYQLNEEITASRAFTTITLLNILIYPMNAFPWILNGMLEGLVSGKRYIYIHSLFIYLN